MKLELKSLVATSALALGVSQAFAATAIGDYATFSGFGTAAVTITDSDEVLYTRYAKLDGAAQGEPSANVDSNFGLQLNVKPTDWLTGTVQVLTIQRMGEENLKTEVEWAFLGFEPIDNLRIRVGRTAAPTFMISDTRNVGYANTWVRAPEEVYALAVLDRLEGADVSYRFNLGSSALTVMALAGESHFDNLDVEVKDVRGLTAEWETRWATFRIAQIQGKSQLEDLGIVGLTGEDKYTFRNAGVSIDRDNIVARAEYATRRSDDFEASTDADGWYVFGGYRFGSVLPYVSYGVADRPVNDLVYDYEQTTLSAGVRWDAFDSGTVKFQVDHVDAHDSWGVSFLSPVNMFGLPTPVTEKVNVATLAVDFVF